MTPPVMVAALCSLAVLTGGSLSHKPPSLQVRPAGRARPTIAFVSTRDNPPSTTPFLTGGEIYLMNSDGLEVRRLTNNDVADIFPVLCRTEPRSCSRVIGAERPASPRTCRTSFS